MSGPEATQATIRVATTSDADAAWKLLDSCRSALREQGIAQWDDVYPTADTVRADIAAEQLFILTTGDSCAGAVVLDRNSDPAYASVPWLFAEPALIVHRLCIAPRLQGKGFGHRLMAFAEQYAAAEGCRSIRLDAYSGNASAVALYRLRGYRQAGELMFPRRTLPFYLFEWAVPDNRAPSHQTG